MVTARRFSLVLTLLGVFTLFATFRLAASFKIAIMEFIEETRQGQNQQISTFIDEGKCNAFGQDFEGKKLSDVFTCGLVQLFNHLCEKILRGMQKPYIEGRRLYNVASADYENEAQRLDAVINEFADSAQRGFGSHARFFATLVLILAKTFILGIKVFIKVTLDLILN